MIYHDERVTLTWNDQSRFANAVSRAVQETVEGLFVKQAEAVRNEAERNEKQRKDFVKHQVGEWNETFDLRITRFATIYGCNAHVVRRGAPHTYEVYQNAHRFNTDEPPQWHVKKAWHDVNRGYVDTVIWDWSSEDFEAVIRRCAMDLMGWS